MLRLVAALALVLAADAPAAASSSSQTILLPSGSVVFCTTSCGPGGCFTICT